MWPPRHQPHPAARRNGLLPLDGASLARRRRAITPTAERIVPPETAPRAITYADSAIGTSSGSCDTVHRAPSSWGIESKPHECTIRAPVDVASASYFRYMRSTNSGSPVRST